MTVFGPDGKLYFSQGAMTNSGVVGLDAYELGWLRRLPHAHDVPGYDIVLAGANFETADPLTGGGAKAETGAFVPFGVRGEAGTRIPAQLPCTAAVMRCNADGGELELVAWGLRNAYGLAFLEDGTLLAIDQGADERGSRPIGNAPDLLYAIRQSAWYGWPDFIGGEPATSAMFRPQRGAQPPLLLANHHELPPPERPLMRFPAHAAAVKFEPTARASQWEGKIFVALFGDERPMTAPAGPHVGRTLAWIDPDSWTLHTLPTTQLVRPIDVRLNPVDDEFYVLDFGVFEVDPARGVRAHAKSGGLWRFRTTPDRTAHTRVGA
jgi:glucose/arabinose dehydrogenase